jgi:protein phosphatase
MGGERCGELAAELAIETVGAFLSMDYTSSDAKAWPFEYDFTLDRDQNRIMNAARLANRRIWETCKKRTDCQGMGTTLSALICSSGRATIGNIGDSRVYVFRGRRLRLLTRDDAVVADLVEAGKITADEARLHPLRNVLTSALGRHEDVAVQLVQLNLKTGDRLLLCSDGVHGPIDQSVIAELLDGQTDPASTARRLVQAAKDQGGPDNISCIVVDIGEDSTNLKN